MKRLTILHIGEDVKQQEFSFTAGGCVNWYIYFGLQLANERLKLNIGISYESRQFYAR